MPNKKAKKKKFDRRRRREAIKKWKRSQKNAKKTLRDEQSRKDKILEGQI